MTVTITYSLICLDCHPNGIDLGSFITEEDRNNVAFYHWRFWHPHKVLPDSVTPPNV
jgi:hypothetical protein